MYHSFQQLLIIDDDSCQNIICALTLKKMFRFSKVNMIGFTNLEDAIHYINQTSKKSLKTTLLFVNFNMPGLDGTKFLEQLEQLPSATKDYLSVYVFTSHPNYNDEQRVLRCPLVKQYLEKPLDNHLHSIFAKRTMELSVDW